MSDGPSLREIAALLAVRALDVCHELLPNGVDKKGEWCVGSLGGEPGNSLKVRLTGAKAGVWKDFSGGPEDAGDLIGLWKRVRNLTWPEAAAAATEWLGLPPNQQWSAEPAKPRPPRIETRAPSRSWIRTQADMRPGTITQLSELAALRKLPSLAGLELATRASHLWFADVWDDGFDWPCWIITDSSRHNAQARRCDGKVFDGIGGKKSKTLKDCEATWPVGAIDALGLENIFFVEGGPDFLAAWHLIWLRGLAATTAPVAMFGVSNPIHAGALPFFKGKNVRLFAHHEESQAGINGAIRWRTQLIEAGAKAVGYFDFGPHGVKDLNDLMSKHGLPELKEVAS